MTPDLLIGLAIGAVLGWLFAPRAVRVVVVRVPDCHEWESERRCDGDS